jgi:flagellar motor protein MotB
MKLQRSDFFWPSYADLMTSLFFVMLVLFVLTQINWNNSINELRKTQKNLEEATKAAEEKAKATQKELDRIKNIQKAVKLLPEDYFYPDSAYNRFSLKQNINFARNSAEIINYHDRVYLRKAGQEIQKLIDGLKRDTANKNVRYIVIVEGMASKDKDWLGNLIDNEEINYPLSYNRARAVQNLWKDNKILTSTDGSMDLQIAGSGTGGIGRDSIDERKNQRILIHIIPKIDVGDIE